MKNKTYICIDLKSFYASVECVERGLNPLTTNLVVADNSRTEKTICLAVSPSLKEYGISGRARLFEVIQKVSKINAERRKKAHGGVFTGESFDANELKELSNLSLSYIVAPPRMAHYIKFSTRVHSVYLKFIAPEDIHVYSIDEVFIDATKYLSTYKLTAEELTRCILRSIFAETGLTATAGIGTNMYLAKIAMDIVAKHAEPDENGARIAELDEMSYRKSLWSHTPITDFWRVGKGYEKRLASVGLYTMGDIARCSVGSENEYYNEDLLYKLFGINAELLIDHAWGWEPCTIADIKAYKPETKSISAGQVLSTPYDFEKAKLIVREMAELLSLELVDEGFVTNQAVLDIGYDTENVSKVKETDITVDSYGRKIPKNSHGTIRLESHTASTKKIVSAVMSLFDRIADKKLTVRRVNVAMCNVLDATDKNITNSNIQLDMFSDYHTQLADKENEKKERKMQETMIAIKKQYGKNSVLKGMNLKEGATTIKRNREIGGHKA